MTRGRRFQRRTLKGTLAVAVVLAGSLVAAGPASAHSKLASTSPADAAVLAAAPLEVRLTFDAPLLDDTDTISINDADGNVVSSIHPQPEGASVAIPWPAGTPAGTYQVAYRVVCGDGHPVVGSINVTLTSAAPAAPGSTSLPGSAAAAPVASTGTPAGTAGASVPLVLGMVLTLGAVLAILAVSVVRRRRTPLPGTASRATR